MKLRALALKLLAGALCLGLLSGSALGQAVVDCSGATPGAFTTITAALASLPAAGPNSVSVVGTCHENVVFIGRSDLIIFGNPTATVVPGNASGHLLAIDSSTRIGIQNITFDGGRGVIVDENSKVDFTSVTVQNSGGIGITSLDSQVHIADSTVQNSVRSGISTSGGAFYVDSDVTGTTVTNNGRSGIAVLTGHLILNGGDGVTPGTQNVFSNNGLSGVEVASTGEADISGDNRIIGNHGTWALLVLNGSSILVTGGTINSNTGLGVHCGGTSHCEFGGGGTQINSNGTGGIEVVEHSDASIDGGVDISGNTGTGVLVDQSSSLTSLGGNTINNNTDDGILLNNLSALKFVAIDTITGNTNDSLECGNGSLVIGDISTLTKKKCGSAFQSKPVN
ncbi:MAG TPA: right-handed parallel beta-helix repeat-containing protein [Candidatus Angelobacter sp.]